MKIRTFLQNLPSCFAKHTHNLERAAKRLGLTADELDRLLNFETRTVRFRVVLRVVAVGQFRLEEVETLTSFGVLRRIDQHRASVGMTKLDQAKAAGVSRENYFALLRKPDCDPNLDTVLRLAEAVEFPLEVVQGDPASGLPQKVQPRPQPPSTPEPPRPTSTIVNERTKAPDFTPPKSAASESSSASQSSQFPEPSFRYFRPRYEWTPP
jgi:DNA-binding phage protein